MVFGLRSNILIAKMISIRNAAKRIHHGGVNFSWIGLFEGIEPTYSILFTTSYRKNQARML